MLKLDLARTPHCLDLGHGVRLHVEPLTSALMMAARADPAVEALPENACNEALALAMAKAVARRAVLDWEGVGDAEGNPLPVSPEGVTALLEIWPIFEAFQLTYVAKGLVLEQEKHCGAPSPQRPKTTVRCSLSRTRCSRCSFTARASTRDSISRPVATKSSGVSAWLTRSVSCSMMGPSSRSAVT